MSSSASRRMRSARNALAEALGLGETYPLRDLPVSAEPPVASFGATARITIDDSERGVIYRLLDQAGQPLPGGAAPEATGDGGPVAIGTGPVGEDLTFTVRAVRANGRTAVLIETAGVKVGLDAGLAVALAPFAGAPAVVDHGAAVTVEIAASQEGVGYRLVARPVPDPAAPDDVAAQAGDVALSDPGGVGGTGGTIRITSLPLTSDTIVRVRVIKQFGGRNPRPPQTVLLAASLPVHVRADAGLAVAPASPIVDHAAPAAIVVAAAQTGVQYLLHVRPVADADFVRAEPPPVPVIEIATADGPVRVGVPELARLAPGMLRSGLAPGAPQPGLARGGLASLAPRGQPAGRPWTVTGDPLTGDGGALTLPLPAASVDTHAYVTAQKTHGTGPDAFTSTQRLVQTAVVLVRPDPQPPLRLEATLTSDRLTRLRALAGEPGVFYALAAAAPLGELYLHQTDPGDAAVNKGVEALAIGVDFVVSGFAGDTATATAPPPVAALDGLALDVPLKLTATARRATTRLTAELGTARVAALPKCEVQPAVAPGQPVTVTLADAPANATFALLVDGKRAADPVAGAAGLALVTGPLAAGAVVELWSGGGSGGDRGGGLVIERRAILPVTVA